MNEKTIKNAQPKTKRYTIAVGESLFLRVSPSGLKSWVLRYACSGAVKDITLGHYPELSLLQARQKAHNKREELKIKPSRGLTFADAFRLWKAKKRGHISSYTDECKRIEQHLMPYLAKMPLEQISAPVGLQVVMKLETKLPTLKRILMRLNEILELAVCAGLLASNPCRKLSKVFAQHTPVNRPYIEAARLGELFSLLNGQVLWFHCYVLFCVYSLLRPVEVSGIKTKWICADILTLPAEVMKKRRPHRVPLCPQVMALIRLTRRLHTHRSGYLFAFGRNGAHINKQHLSKFLERSPLKGKLCHHGLRATGRTWMRDQGVAHEVAEDALAHLSGSATERAYLRGDYLEQRREVMFKWWTYLFTLYCASCADDPSGKRLIKALSRIK